MSRSMLKKDRMEHLSCYIPRKHIEKLDELVKKGVYPSRSEVIREAIRRLLRIHGEENLVKVVCDCCNGDGFIVRRKHPTGEEIKVRCPCCDGLGYDYAIEWKGKEK